jgi:ribosomal subunit interface protein
MKKYKKDSMAKNEQPISLKVTYRGFDSSEAVNMTLKQHVEKLERFRARATSCEVVVSKPHRHHSQGQIFHIELRLHIPGRNIFVNREPEHNDAHADVYIAIRDAFNAMERQLEDVVRIRRGSIKQHIHHENQNTNLEHEPTLDD